MQENSVPEVFETELQRYSWNQAFVNIVAYALKPVRCIVTESIQYGGLDNLMHGESPINGPLLFLPGHVSWHDFVNYFHAWETIPQHPKVKVIVKEELHDFEYLATKHLIPEMLNKLPGVNQFYRRLWEIISIPVSRQGTGGNVQEGTENRQWNNKEQLGQLVKSYTQKYFAGIFPEGTTKGPGEISHIHIGGTYFASHWSDETGALLGVPMVCVGNTYDLMSGNKNCLGMKKNLVFFNFGEPFMYSPVKRQEGESDREYLQRDKAELARIVREQMVSLNTITVSQLGMFYLFDQIDKGNDTISLYDLGDAIGLQARALQDLGRKTAELNMDDAFLDPYLFDKRTDRLLKYLIDNGYVCVEHDEIILDKDRIVTPVEHEKTHSRENEFKNYKKNKPLYTVRKIMEFADTYDVVGDTLSSTLQSEVLDNYWRHAKDNPFMVFKR